MADLDKAKVACEWLRRYFLTGKVSVGEESNGIRRSINVDDGVLEQIRALCDEFDRLEEFHRGEMEMPSRSALSAIDLQVAENINQQKRRTASRRPTKKASKK